MSAKLVSLTTRCHGEIEPERDSTAEESPFIPVDAKWKDLKEEVKGKRWSECRPEMVADYVKATAALVELEYGKNTCLKMSQMLAGGFMGNWQNSCQFKITSKKGPEIALRFFVQPVGFANPEGNKLEGSEPGEAGQEKAGERTVKETAELGFKVSKGEAEEIDQTGAKQALLGYLAEPGEKRTAFDPLTELEDEAWVELARQIENQWQNGKVGDIDLLVTAAAVVVTWRYMERHNANDLTNTLGGLTKKGKEIRPGFEAVVKAQAKLYKADLESTQTQEGARAPEQEQEQVEVAFTVTAKRRTLH